MIRTAAPQDASQIADIWNHAIRETTITFNPDEKAVAEVAALCQQNCLVAVDGDAVLGFARYFPFRGGAGYRFTAEHTIMLLPSAQGRGVGRALLGTLCESARVDGMHIVLAACSAENAGAIAFYQAAGFTRVATLPDVGFKFGRWIDLVLMQKRL